MENLEWATLLDQAKCKAAGIDDHWHQVYFLPKSENILGRCIGLGIPECELHVLFCAADGHPIACINRPQKNHSVRRWLKTACAMATEQDCTLILTCNTREQAANAAAFAARRLLNHRRVPIERMYDPTTRTMRGLM
jgi:hypothetical protein